MPIAKIPRSRQVLGLPEAKPDLYGFNAVKHGIFSNEIFLANLRNPAETHQQFLELVAGLWKDYAPEGTSEELLVQHIALEWWRLARSLRFELRETRRAIQIGNHKLPDDPNADDIDDGIFERLRVSPEQTLLELDGLIEKLQACLHLALEQGYLEQTEWQALQSMPGDIYQRCLALAKEEDRQVVVVVEPPLKGAAPSPENKVSVLLAEELQRLLDWRGVCELVLRLPWLQGVLRLPDLPGKEAAEQLLHFETTIQRNLFRKMHELERLQLRRKGE